MQEKRDYERLSLDGAVRIKALKENLQIEEYLENVSFGGFAVFGQGKIEPGTEVDFELRTPVLDGSISGKAKVRYLFTPERYKIPLTTMGVSFTDTNKDLVTYLIKRIQFKASEQRVRKQAKPVDYIPY